MMHTFLHTLRQNPRGSCGVCITARPNLPPDAGKNTPCEPDRVFLQFGPKSPHIRSDFARK